MKSRTKNNIIAVILVIIFLIVCVGFVAFVYITKYGTPNSSQNALPVVEAVLGNINLTSGTNISVRQDEKNIIFEKKHEAVVTPQTIVFEYSNEVFSTTISSQTVDTSFENGAIRMMFEAVAQYLEQDRTLAVYALEDEMLSTKTLKVDGYELSKDLDKNTTTFKIGVDKKLNLLSKEDAYFSSEQILSIGNNILADKLQYARLNRSNLILEKNISYTDEFMIFSIYEKGDLSQRGHNTLMTLLKAVTDDKTLKYVKENYPQITNDGILILDGIILSINKDYTELSHTGYVKESEYDEYIRVYIDTDIYSIKEVQ